MQPPPAGPIVAPAVVEASKANGSGSPPGPWQPHSVTVCARAGAAAARAASTASRSDRRIAPTVLAPRARGTLERTLVGAHPGSIGEMAQERDLFANFERMRREMDELFGDVLDRGLAPRRRGGFSPAVDVYYSSDPPRAVVRADLAGIDPSAVQLEITGRELVLSGHRETESADDRVYQQLEIERGPFRRVISLGAEVDSEAADATYEDGILTVELPLTRPASRTVPIRGTDR